MEITLIPALQNNYIFWLNHNGQNIIIDPAQVAPVTNTLGAKTINAILLTHHHPDHIGGATELANRYNCPIYGGAKDVATGRLPLSTIPLTEGSKIDLPFPVNVLETFGHTGGHVSYYLPKNKVLFAGDTIFAGGCGRVFDGTHKQLFESLKKINALPAETKIYCAHEYTQSNLEFALSIKPTNKAIKTRLEEVNALRKNKRPTIPTTLKLEQKTNLFLQAKTLEEFTTLRNAKDNF